MEQMKVNRERTFKSLKFVKDNYPEISGMMEIAIKNKIGNIREYTGIYGIPVNS